MKLLVKINFGYFREQPGPSIEGRTKTSVEPLVTKNEILVNNFYVRRIHDQS